MDAVLGRRTDSRQYARTMRNVAPPLPALFVAIIVGGLGACSTRDNPATCDSTDRTCHDGLVCDLRRNQCVSNASADGPLPGRDGGDGPARADAGPPDAAGSCSDNNHCQGELKFCFENRCVGCREGADCPRRSRGRPRSNKETTVLGKNINVLSWGGAETER